MREKSDKKRFTSYLEPELHQGLRELNAKTHVPLVVYINEAVTDLLKKHNIEVKK